MNRIFLISISILYVLVGCHSADIPKKIEIIEDVAPSAVIHNQECEEIEQIELFQVLSNGALATVCEKDKDYCHGLIVFVPTKKGEDFYDGKRIKVSNDKCISYNGVYKYISKDEQSRTVPKIKVTNAQISNPKYKEWINQRLYPNKAR